MAQTPQRAARRYDELLDAAVDHVIAEGMDNLSVRTLATALGVAHNTITHHFGNRAELEEAIIYRLAERIRSDTREQFPLNPVEPHSDLTQRMTVVWEYFSQPRNRAVAAAFFEAVGRAVQAPDNHRAFLDQFVTGWVVPDTERLEQSGIAHEDAAARAILVVAAMRGLTLHALASEPAQIDAAFALLRRTVASWSD